MQERDAIGRLREGDISGLAFLVRAYQARAVRAATLITRDPSLAEDIVQSAFLRAYERIAQFDPQRPFGPWFLQSVVNDALKAAQREYRHQSWEAAYEQSGAEPQALEPSPEEQVVRAENLDELQRAMSALSPIHRAAITQRYYLGLSEKEMANIAKIAPGTIKSRLHTARARLLQSLSPQRSGTE